MLFLYSEIQQIDDRLMPYYTFIPAPRLQPYIEMYWLMTEFWAQPERITLTPDGSMTLMLNLGEAIHSRHFGLTQNEGIYLIGTMSRSDEQVLHGAIRLFGIQFRPGAFTHFYQYEPLSQIANQVCEFEQKLFPDIKKIVQDFVPYIDQFYLERLSSPRNSLLTVVKDVENLGGQVKIETLAKRHCMTERQLERRFNEQIGISPKEFINLTRFRQAFVKIQMGGTMQNQHKRSLADIAWECGYYDHAHLTNDFKRYAGSAPTELILSDFSKTIALNFE